MKKSIGIIALMVLLVSASLVYAKGMKGSMMDKEIPENTTGKDRMKGGMMDKGMMGMHGMMMKMMEKTVVATSDGGIVIVSANKISKYDKNLNLVKEVELKADMDGMQKMMSEMMAKCPMMGKDGMMGGMMGDMKSDTEKPSEAQASPEADHASHHPSSPR